MVVGGGFGGVKAALELLEDHTIDVTLISDNPSFRYHPSLYHIATGGHRVQSLIELKDIFEDKPINLVLNKAEKLDRLNQKVITSDGKSFYYDRLVLALGAVTNYYGIKGLERYSYGIKSYKEAIELKNHLHKQLTANKDSVINYIVVGGGPTGVELAGAMPDYIKKIMKSHGIKSTKGLVSLVEASNRLLPSMPKDISRQVKHRLKRVGVKVLTNTAVTAETANALLLNGKPINSKSVIWTAGTKNNSFFKRNDFKLGGKGLVAVGDFLEAESNIYVIGDNADTKYSGMAQTAIHQADFVAENIKKRLQKQSVKPYKPKRPVFVIPAGPRWAAVLWGKFRIYGRLGWWLRRMADFIAYRDVETWWEAAEHWFAGNVEEEDCPKCMLASISERD